MNKIMKTNQGVSEEWEKEFETNLRFEIGYSGGAMDSDIVSCETIGGRKSSMRFDVLSEKIIDCVRQLLAKDRESQRTELLKAIKEIDTKEHICRFNDGEQNCDCYLEAIADIKTKLQ